MLKFFQDSEAMRSIRESNDLSYIMKYNSDLETAFNDNMVEIIGKGVSSEVDSVLNSSYMRSNILKDQFLSYSDVPKLRRNALDRLLTITGEIPYSKRLKFMTFIDLAFEHNDILGAIGNRSKYLKKGLQTGIIDRQFIDYLKRRYKSLELN